MAVVSDIEVIYQILIMTNLNGVYTFGAEAQNSPVDGSGKCLTFGNGIDDYGQIVVTWDSRLIYYRGKIGAAWKRIQTE